MRLSKVIEMLHVKKVFGENVALADINCTVSEGEIFGLLGPSGAGKTTIINILTGQLKNTDGSSEVFEVNSGSLTDDIYSRIGMVMDKSGLYTRLSCYDNLVLFARIHNIKKGRIKEVLSQVDLLEDIKKPVSKLSKGMMQRLIFARAILHRPKLLFLDEPTSGLDPTTAAKIHQLINELRNEGTTIFLTTHNMSEATKLCDNVALLNEGTIVEYGSPDEICRKYNDEDKVKILCKDGSEITLSNSPQSAETIMEFFKEDKVLAIHSSEPNLETVFLRVTGRGLTE